MGRPFLEYLNDDSRPKYVCAHCHADLASSCALVWEGFMGTQQPAYLFRSTVNLEASDHSYRQERLTTGVYELADVQCRVCSTVLGWKYIRAANREQRYKEGGSLLQQQLLERV